MKKCTIPEYIDKRNFPQEEKERLTDIHVDVFKMLKNSGHFKPSKGNLISKTQTFSGAYRTKDLINDKYKAKVVSITKENSGDLVAYVNVIPLTITPSTSKIARQGNVSNPSPTLQELLNRKDLEENEPYVTSRNLTEEEEYAAFYEAVEEEKRKDAKLISNISEDEEYSNLSNNGTAAPSKVDDKGQGLLFQYVPQQTEEIVASEKTIRDLAARMSDRIGIPIFFESDRTKQYKGKLENGKAYINLAYATLDTPIHEILGHPIIRAIKNKQNVTKRFLGNFNEKFFNNQDEKIDTGKTVTHERHTYKVYKLKKYSNIDYYAYNFERHEQIELSEKEFNDIVNESQLYKNLLKELETGKGKEVLDRIKRDYKYKTTAELITDRFGRYGIKEGNSEEFAFDTKEEAEAQIIKINSKEYTLEEQQEEAIVELLGLMTAEKLDNVKDGKLISLLKRLLKEMKSFMKSLIKEKEVEINKLPDSMTLGDIADLLAYSNSKLILPGYQVTYTTPDNNTFKTYQEASNHISELANIAQDVDLDNINLNIRKKINNVSEISVNKFTDEFMNDDFERKNGIWYYKGTNTIIDNDVIVTAWNSNISENNQSKSAVEGFIEKNKEFEQSKEIIEEWKKVNNIQYNPEEIYSRGQEFSSVVGAYSSFDVNLMMQNLLQHIEDNEKAGGQFAISAYTKPVYKEIGHLEGGGGKIKFKLYPQSQDILWAANIDVYSGSVWDASEKVNKDKKSELLGVSYTKYPSLQNVNSVQPNLASIIDDLAHHHNELGIVLTGNNFRLEYDESIPFSTKKIIASINKILDQKYGKLVKPEIKPFARSGASILGITSLSSDSKGIQPTQTNETLKETIDSINNKKNKYIRKHQLAIEPINEKEFGIFTVGGNPVKLGFATRQEANKWIEENAPKEKEYTSQALINTKIAALKEAAKKYPRSLIRSEVVRTKEYYPGEFSGFEEGELPFQKLASSEINYQLKAISIINKNLPKIQQWEKQIKDLNALWNKIQKDLQVPQAQIELLRNSEGVSVEDKLLSFSANYSFSVESNVAKEQKRKYGNGIFDRSQLLALDYRGVKNADGKDIKTTLVRNQETGEYVSDIKLAEKIIDEYNSKVINASYYSNLTVAGGTNYTENEISTPLITPSIKGHAQFSTDNGIGWFRSDDKVDNGTIDNSKNVQPTGNLEFDANNIEGIDEDGYPIFKTAIKTKGGITTKTRRILEVQSDLFQKGRDKNQLVDKLRININKGDVIYNGEQFMYSQSSNFYSKKPANEMGTENRIEITKEEYENAVKNNQNVYVNTETENQNQFLQLLNKDNNWVTFFVKSIIQDSAKKGYEKVLFPSGNTASKVEGHTTLEEFKKQKEDRIKELKENNELTKPVTSTVQIPRMSFNFITQENRKVQIDYKKRDNDKYGFVATYLDTNEIREINASNVLIDAYNRHVSQQKEKNDNEISQLKRELENVEREGFGALKPIYNFYENTVTNILSKTYNVETITDEYGNTWNEVKIDPVRDASPIVFSLPQQQYNKYQTEANEETIEKVKALLAKLGVSVEITDKVMEEFGANALIDLSRRLIQMVEGKESESLTEEAMHLLAALLPEDILADLLSKITSYQIYKDTLNQYKNHPSYQNEDGTPNIDKIKFEAVGKLLAEFYIKRSENLGEDEINAAKNVWSRILDWIKNIFSRQMNEFEKVIQGLEDGTLTLLSTPSRQDKFLNVTFAKVEAEKLTGILTNGAVNTDITENASTPNAKILYAISQQIDRIAAEDSKKLNSFKQAFSYMNKQAFSEATLKLNNAREIEELKERAYNAISYYSSLGNISIAMTDRAKSIRMQYKAGVNKAGEALSDDEKLYMSLEIDKMDRAAEIYIKELEEFRILFIDSDLEPFAKSIANTTKEFTSLLANNENVKIDMLKDVLAKGLKSKLEGYLKNNKKRELELIRMIPSLTGKEKINKQKELQEVQKNIATPPFSVNSIIADIMGPGNGKSLQGISDWVDRMMAGGKTIKNEAAQLVASVLEDINRDSRKQAEISMSEMQKIFEDAKIKLGITGTEYDRFIEAVTRYQIKETSTGKELAVYEEYVLLSGLQQWKYENQMEVISYLKWAANAGKTEEEMNQVFERVFARKLTDAEKNNYPATFKNIQKELYEVYGQSKYTQEYKDVQAILEATVLSTGKTVKSVREEYIDKIKKRSNDLEEAITPEQILTALDEKNIALKELQLLSSTYKNGVKKTGDDLIVAQTINRWAKEKKDKKIDEYYLSNQNKVRWDEAKEKVDKLAVNDPERVAWYAANTAIEISQDYYDEHEDISTKLANLFNRIKPKSLKDKGRIDDLYYDLRQLTKGKRDGNGVVVGSEFNEEEVKIIKEIELALKEIRDIANESSEKISKEDAAEMNNLLAQLDDIQTKSLTEYWDDALEVAMMQIDANLSAQEQDEALQKSNFIKNNTINVTDKYTASTFKKPENIIQIGNKYYQPLTIWQHTTPSAEFKTIVSPSFKWKTYKVNDDFRNINHETNQGNVALNNSTESIKRFGSTRHDNLTPADKTFLSNLTNFYLKLQQDHPQYERMNLSIPRLQAEGALRAKQRLVNSKTLFSGITTKAYWENIVNLTPTEKETQYGEGLNIDEDRLNVNSKFIGNHIPLKRQEKDLYKIFGTYAAETARAKSMRNVVPVLNTLKKIQNKDNPINKNINYEINKRVNMKNRLDKGVMRSISNWSDIAMGGLGFTRLGTPWLLTSTLKNTAVGLWNIAVNNSYLRKFSKGSILIAVKRAMKTATIVSANEFSSNPPKELAIIRRLSILSGKTMLETTNLNKDFLLKAAMATGYGMSALRKWSEMHLELTMYELIKMQYKIETGRELLDEYDYVNNQLTPKNITSEKENEITKQSENMNFYTHGNFRGDNSPLAKAYFLGRALLFMKGYIYNPSIKRIGSKRLISTGEEMEGFYKIFWRVAKQSPTSVLTHLSSKDNYFSAEEKSAVWAMYKDFAFINVLGGALYLWAQALKESGDDDDDAPLEWYGLLLSRKIYQEMSWANPADLVGKPLSALLSKDSQRNKGGQIESLLYYTVGRPAMDFAAQTIIPIDYKGLRFEEDDIKKNKDPFYSQFKDNWILFDLMKSLKMKGDMFYPQSSLSGFEYFDRSIYQYEKEERGQRTTGSKKKRKSTRRKD